MLTKRIWSCLDVKPGRIVKEINFAKFPNHHG
jgi:imidazole glycerol phosphate synthase subunit HisF